MGKTFIICDIINIHKLMDKIEINDGANLVKPSVAFKDPVATISLKIATPSNMYACVKVITYLYNI